MTEELVCAGGGSFGVTQVRTLRTIQKQKGGKLPFTKLRGTSTGNLSVVCLAHAPTLDDGLNNLENVYTGIKGTSDIFDSKAGIGIPIIGNIADAVTVAVDEVATSWPGLVSNAPLLRLLQSKIPNVVPCVPVTSFVVSEETGSLIEVTHNTDGTFTKIETPGGSPDTQPIVTIYPASWWNEYILFVLASTSFPPECDAQTISGEGGLVDGGVLAQVPVDGIVSDNPNSVTILLCGGWGPLGNYSGSRTGLDYALRTINVMLYWQVQKSISDITLICKKNGWGLTIYTVPPDINLGSSAEFSPAVIQEVLNAPDSLPVYQLAPASQA